MLLPLFGGVYLTVFAANLLIFISGTTLTWSSSEIPKLIAGNLSHSPFEAPISPEQASWISSLITLGAAAGPFVFGWLADKIGRKSTLLYLGVPLLFSYVMLAFGTNVEVFYVARFIAGVALGGTFTVLPIYIGEVSPPAHRGALSSSMGCFCCLGLFFSVTVGPFVAVKTFNAILAGLPIAYLIGFCAVAPESPAYLVGAGEEQLARETLERLGRGKEELEKEMAELAMGSEKEERRGKTCFDIFRSKGTIKAFMISLGLMIFQQFSGINAVLFYSQQIFKETGSRLPPKYCAMVVVGVQFLSSFVTPLIADKYGRKHILLLSAVGMVISELPLGIYCYLKLHGVNLDSISFLPLFALTTFILFFNIGFGPLPWLIICEVFPTSLKSAATALVSTLIWLLSFLVTKYFERAVKAFGLGEMFLFFALCCLGAVFFARFYVIETKGKSYPEILAELNGSTLPG